jgi:TonB family protein
MLMTLAGAQSLRAQDAPKFECPATGKLVAHNAEGTIMPSAKHLLLSPTAPASLKGQEVSVRMVVNAAGRVERESIKVCGVPDADFEKTLVNTVAAFEFNPAKRAQKAVAAEFILTMLL